MIVNKANDFIQTIKQLNPQPKLPATAKAVMMIAPDNFAVLDESATDNHYMDLNSVIDPARAYAQQRELAKAIMQCGLPVFILPGAPGAPDAVFPNNVFATTNNRFIIGAMKHPVRQKEAKRDDIKQLFNRLWGYEVIDLSQKNGCVAELTGVLVADRARNISFIGMTDRINIAGVKAMHQAFKFDLSYYFDLNTTEYHLNVVMSVLASRACVIVNDAFTNEQDVKAIEFFYDNAVIRLNTEEKQAFAGNCIALTQHDVLISQTGFNALSNHAKKQFARLGFKLHTTQLDEIEKAGGSLRCMVAEIF